MAIFANSAATQANAVPNSATKIWNASASGIPTGATLGDVIVQNTGAVTMFIGSASVSTTGLRVPPGAQVTISGFGAVQGNTNYDIYAIAASSTGTTSLCGLATVDQVV
jgi:hypothetical protein